MRHWSAASKNARVSVNSVNANTLISAAVGGAATLTTVLLFSGDNDDRAYVRFPKLSTISAAQKLNQEVAQELPNDHVIKPSSKENRRHYNFIADVVEHTAPAVVFIDVIMPTDSAQNSNN